MPRAKVEVVKLKAPEALSVPLAICVVPSRITIGPEGVPVVVEVTVAVSVTGVPRLAGLLELARTVFEPAAEMVTEPEVDDSVTV